MKTTVNNGKRTVLFWFLAATFFLSLMAHGAGAAKFGTLRNSDWVVTNAWIAASNRVDSFVSNYTFRVADDGTNYADFVALSATNYANWIAESATNYANFVAESSTNYTDSAISNVMSTVKAGATDWYIPEKYDGVDIILVYTNLPGGTGWAPFPVDMRYNIGIPKGDLSSTNLVWTSGDAAQDIHASRILLRPTPEMEAYWNSKQDSLTFDSRPAPTSMNPVTSEGIYQSMMSLELMVINSALDSTNYVNDSISTNNAAFVAAVLAAPIAGASPSDLADIAEYGSYGTVGAAILALIAGLAALKRDKANKTDLPYPFVTATVTQDGPQLPASAFPIAGSYDGTAFSLAESDITIAENESTGEWMVLAYSGGLTICVYTSAGVYSAAGTNITNLTFGGESTPPSMEFPNVLTVTPRTVATYTADSSAAAFTVAVGTGVSGAARDCVLVVDCTAAGAVAPSVTWSSNFHPRGGDAEEIAPVAGVRNVFYISEYATGEFVVGGWHEEAE